MAQKYVLKMNLDVTKELTPPANIDADLTETIKKHIVSLVEEHFKSYFTTCEVNSVAVDRMIFESTDKDECANSATSTVEGET